MNKLVAMILLMLGATTVMLAGGAGFAPEIDPGSAVSALTLTLAAGAMLFRTARRKR